MLSHSVDMLASLLVIAIALPYHVEGKQSLGPGAGPWEHASPEAHGLSSSKLEAAAALLKEAAPHRYCLLVAKDGYLVHESYFANKSSTRYRTQSLGKSMVAAMIGTLVQKGLIDLDKPLASYGVPRNASWNLTGTDYWPMITARHLLSQASGYGKVPPGKFYTYDSNDYIQHLSSLIRKATGGQSPTDYARKAFAEPMGFPDIFDYDGYIYDIGNDISAGGGQMMSCEQIARVGQLLLNKGQWRKINGDAFQLLTESYVKQQTSPSFPEANLGYGFLTWLQFKVPPESNGTSCCAPRWAGTKRCTPDGKQCASCCEARPGSSAEGQTCALDVTGLSQGAEYRHQDPTDPQEFYLREGGATVEHSMIGDGAAKAVRDSLPDDLILMQGENGAYAFVVPSRNLTVVTMGLTRPYGSDRCWKAYDDVFGVNQVWGIIADSITPRQGRFPLETPRGHEQHRGLAPHDESQEAPSTLAAARAASSPTVGSCQCDCPRDQGFGFCFNVDAEPPAPSGSWDKRNPCQRIAQEKPSTQIGTLLSHAENMCPRLGTFLPCNISRDAGVEAGTALCRDITRNSGSVLLKECAPIPGTDTTALTCDIPVNNSGNPQEFGPCIWRTEQCIDNPYYPLYKGSERTSLLV